MTSTAAIILAAGPSLRLGSPKQLVDLGGKPLLETVVASTASWPIESLVVVLGSSAEEVLDAVDFGDATVVLNEAWDEGIASSLRVGLDVLARDSSWERVFVVLGDQIGIPPEVPQGLLEAAGESARAIVVPVYRFEPGYPALFARSLWPRLMALSGDSGISGLLRTHPDWIEEVRFPHLPPPDIDTVADVADLDAGHRGRTQEGRRG